MLHSCLIFVTFFILVPSTFGAVLTTITTSLYFPQVHRTNAASENGVLSFLGEANGMTTYLFTDPGDGPSFKATLIEGSEVAIALITDQGVLVSLSCDYQAIGAASATCDIAAIAISDSHTIKLSTETDSFDSVAFIDILPVSTPTPTPMPTTTTTTAISTSNSSPGAAQPPPSTPTSPVNPSSNASPAPASPIPTSSSTSAPTPATTPNPTPSLNSRPQTASKDPGIQGFSPQGGQSNSGRNSYIPTDPIQMITLIVISVFAGLYAS